jgi:spore maturation protein CgeB
MRQPSVLCCGLSLRGHDVLFLERDVPWYASNRDLREPDFCRLDFYSSLEDLGRYRDAIKEADAVIVGSYVPEGVDVGRYVQRMANGVVAFYDIDTPVTLAKLEKGDYEYLAPNLIPNYNIYFSFTGGPTLDLLMERYGSPAAKALYCSVDPEAYPRLQQEKRWDLSYLGTYSSDRQPTLERLLIEPARKAPHLRFVVAGPQYPAGTKWPENVERIEHVPPSEHPTFYAQSRYTLNVTRADMIRAGYSPSVRLFEAAACGTPIISDIWDGIETLLEPDREILLARQSGDVLDVLETWSDGRARELGAHARRRILGEHTAAHRAASMERDLFEALGRQRQERPLALAVES